MIDSIQVVPDTWRRAGGAVAVIGLGKSGVAVTRLLAREGVRVYASDASDHPYAGAAADELRDIKGVEVEYGRHDLDRIDHRTLSVASAIMAHSTPRI